MMRTLSGRAVLKAGVSVGAAALIGLASPALAQTATPTPTRSSDDIVTGVTGAATDRVIVFGDSLSDGGFFAAVAPLPPGAGSFTTNPDPVAPEVLAGLIGLPLDPVYGRGGYNYAVGGARVTQPSGPSIPIATQISNFLAANPRISGTDLFYIQGGGNDFFAFGRGGGTDPAILTTAANDLAAQVLRLQNAGASRIITMSVQSAGQAGIQLFNATYEAALARAGANVLFVDVDQLFNEILTNPGEFGIRNVTDTACIGSSLTCTRDTLVAPDANETYARADDVHPTGIVQRIQGQLIASLLRAPDLIGNLAYGAQGTLRAQRDMVLAGAETHGRLGGRAGGRAGGGTALWISGGYHRQDRDGSAAQPGFSERGPVLAVGLDAALGAGGAAVGLAGSYADTDGDFQGLGGYDARQFAVTAYGRTAVGPVRLLADATYGRLDLDDITRTVVMGPAVRQSVGETKGDVLAARIAGAATLGTVAGLAIGPEASLTYERIDIDGYAERQARSNDAAFGDQRLTSLTGRLGLLARSADDAPVRVALRAAYAREFDNDVRTVTITSVGAPVSYTTGVAMADRDYFTGGLAIDGTLTGNLGVRAGVTGELGRGDMDRIAAHAGVTLAF